MSYFSSLRLNLFFVGNICMHLFSELFRHTYLDYNHQYDSMNIQNDKCITKKKSWGSLRDCSYQCSKKKAIGKSILWYLCDLFCIWHVLKWTLLCVNLIRKFMVRINGLFLNGAHINFNAHMSMNMYLYYGQFFRFTQNYVKKKKKNDIVWPN